MPIYEARVIKKPRSTRYCSNCRGAITGLHIAIFGCAFSGDKPYWIRVHGGCEGEASDKKSKEKLDKARELFDTLTRRLEER